MFTKLFSTKNSKSKSKKSDEEKMKVIQVDIQEVASNDHDPSSVFVDLLLSSLSRLNGMNQRLLRDVIKSIFKTVSSVLSATAISTMLGAITQKHNLDKEEESDDEFEPIDPSIQNHADEEMDTDMAENTQTSSNAKEESDDSSESDSDKDDDSNQPEDEIGEDEYMELLETQFTMLSNKTKR